MKLGLLTMIYNRGQMPSLLYLEATEKVIKVILKAAPTEDRMTWFPVFRGGSDSKESACNAGDLGSVPRLGRSPGEGNDYPLQYSCLENSMDRRAWWATVHGVTKSWAQLGN